MSKVRVKTRVPCDVRNPQLDPQKPYGKDNPISIPVAAGYEFEIDPSEDPGGLEVQIQNGVLEIVKTPVTATN